MYGREQKLQYLGPWIFFVLKIVKMRLIILISIYSHIKHNIFI